MKKLTTLLLSLTLLLGLAACGDTGTTQDTTPPAESTGQVSTSAPASTAASDSTPAPGSASEPEPAQAAEKVLVVYFSATSNTQRIAEAIADTLDADLFPLVPVEEYTSADLNYNDSASRVSREHADPSLQDVELEASTVDNWEEYSAVFIGFPIWWHAAAWPVNGFVTDNDFTGKIVIPFCTSGSSGLEDSGTKLRDMAGTGTWLEGQRFSGRASQADVENWVNGLDLTAYQADSNGVN